MTLTKADQDLLFKILSDDDVKHRHTLGDAMGKDPVWIPRFNLSLQEERELALQRLKFITK